MLTRAESLRICAAFLIASALGLRGLQKGSLSRSGAASAFVVGFLSFCAGSRFGLTLIAFYLLATRATRFRAARKRVIEDGFTLENGNRGAGQVLASSLPAVLFAVAYAFLYRHDTALSAEYPDRTVLQITFLLFFAACAGDTLSSELGTVLGPANAQPVLLIAPWRKVPRGTNGAVSWAGTAASAAGGAVVGAAFFVTGPTWSLVQSRIITVGAIGGLLGSTWDSVLGAVLQASFYDPETGKVLKETPPKGSRVANRAVHITGVDLLGGEAVILLPRCLRAVLRRFLCRGSQVNHFCR